VVHALALCLLQPVVPIATVVAFGSRLSDSQGDLLPNVPLWVPAAMVVTGTVALAVVVGLGLLLPLRGRLTLSDLGWRRDRLARVVILGVVGAVVCSGAVIGGIALFGGDARAAFAQVTGYSLGQRLVFAVVGTQIALAEETIFRGFLQSELTRRIGLIASTLVTAAVYALYHIPNVALLSALIRLTQGLLYSLMRGRDRPLWAPALAHALYWSTIGLL
jgi:membrane protease YdiL (CAAX protease family)